MNVVYYALSLFFILYFGVIYIFSKDINTFIQQGCIQLLKSDSKCIIMLE